MSETYGSLLREIRKEAGHTVTAFAEMLGVSLATLSAVELNKRGTLDPFMTVEFMCQIGMDHHLDRLLTLQAESRGYVEFDKNQPGIQWETLVKLRNKTLLGTISPEQWQALGQILNEEPAYV